jgi:hypothetical protein
MKRACILLLTALLPSAAFAQPSYRTPPIEVYAPQQPYYTPPPPAYALEGFVGAIVALPFEFLGVLFGFPQYPQAAMVPDGIGGSVPASNSRIMPDGTLRQYDPSIDGMPSGPYPSITPAPEQAPAYYAPRQPYVHHAPSRPAPLEWHDPNPSPKTLPDTREWREPNERS